MWTEKECAFKILFEVILRSASELPRTRTHDRSVNSASKRASDPIGMSESCRSLFPVVLQAQLISSNGSSRIASCTSDNNNNNNNEL